MKKRTVVRVGDVFCVEIDNSYKVYFQFLVRDLQVLNSEVIRVFRKRWPIESNPTIEEIVSDEVGFYTHAFIRVGINKNSWYKVGPSKDFGGEAYKKVLLGFTNNQKMINPPYGIYINPLEN